MPFGLTNAPSYFMNLMNKVFMEELDKFVVVFIDNILIYSRSVEEHEQHLRVILNKLRAHELYAKFNKCEFWLKEVTFLGHIITTEGVKVDLEMVKAVSEFKWTEACKKSFQELKTQLTTAPILTLLDIHKSFIVYCDASRQGLGCILMQDDKVVAYASR